MSFADRSEKHPLYTTALSLFILFCVGYLLILGQRLLIPFVVALFLWYLVNVLAGLFGKLRIAGVSPPGWARYLAACSVLAVAIHIVIGIITSSVGELITAAPEYQRAFQRLAWDLQERFEFIDIPEISQFIAEIRVANYIRMLAATFSGFVGNLGLIAIFLLFLFVEQRYFKAKINALMPDSESRAKLYDLLADIDNDIRTYIGIKTAASFATAVACYLVMSYVGLNFAGFWALLVFVLNFIPNIGSIVATVLPSLLAMVQFDTLTPFLIVALGITLIQFTIGQIIEPLFAGKTLNVTPLAIIFSLGIWGTMWGIAGAFLCVPILVISMIILFHFDSTRWLAILLSQNGRIARRARITS
ncbi:MAG TPA: AI-2E family transporter [Rhodocyclaceae bacterium]|nr:AI-2E family transporter [Rhodocyclaceae bacterium]